MLTDAMLFNGQCPCRPKHGGSLAGALWTGGCDLLRRACTHSFVLAVLAAALLGSHAPGKDKLGDTADPNKSDVAADVFFLNEDLTYEVSWMGIPLGSIRTIITHQQISGNEKVNTAVAYIQSYSGVPFVKLHEVDETMMNRAGIPFSFHSREKIDEKWKFVDYTFDHPKKRLIAKESMAESETGSGSVVSKIDTLNAPSDCVDGLSLLFYARVNARTNKRTAVPTFIKGKQGTTRINFYQKETSEDIDAVDYPVDVVEIDGQAEFSGILGMSGEFTGWFSNDNAQIPIKGKFKIMLGSITIELKQWHRTGWNPPQYRSGR